jgi:hypothetical protein
MAGATSVGLDKAYQITDAAGVGQFLAVVADGAGKCKKPAAANAAAIVGVTQEAQLNQNRFVNVRKEGITRAVAAGAIAVGDHVNIAGATGKVQSCEASITALGAAQAFHVLGIAETAAAADGDIVYVHIRPFVVLRAAS